MRGALVFSENFRYHLFVLGKDLPPNRGLHIIPRAQRFFSPPVFPGDPDKTIAAAMVHYGIVFGLLANIVHVPVMILAGDPPARIVTSATIVIAGLLLNLFFLKRGHVRSAGAVFLFVAWLTLAGVNLTAGGVKAPGFVIHIIFIICAGFIFGGRWAFFAAAISTLLGLFFVFLEGNGRLPPLQVSNTPARYWWIFSSSFFIIAAILTLMVNRLRTTIAASRRELLARQETERQLERHQAALEDTVRERTEALARTNEDLLQEVVERRRAEEALRREKDFIGQLMETSPLGILVVDTEGRFTFANAAAEQVLGRSREAITRLSCTAAIWRFTNHHGRPLPPEELPFSRAMKDGVLVSNAPVAIASPDGRRVLLSVNAAPLGDAGGKPRGSIVTIEDVTERQRLEQEIFRAQKLESVGVLAGGIAHDFNNLLTAIMGSISLAEMNLPPGGATAGILAEAEKAALQARELTRQLLTFSRGGAPVKKTIHLRDVITSATQFTLRGANVRALYNIPPDLWAVEADQGQIGQVFHNLGINACQAMPAGGTINLEAANVVVGEKNGVPLPSGRYVMVSVADQGAGIAPENLAKVFDPFFSTKESGTGLGLAVAYSVVKNHGGHIGIESKVGKGTTFTVHLPAADGTPPPAVPRFKTYSGRGRILFMDDEPIVRGVVARILSAIGYEAETAVDGAEAIAAYREAREKGQPFDAVILDLTIPGGMGGAAAIRGLQAIDPDVKAVVSSGYSNDPVMSRYREYGFRNVIAKPFQANDLSRVLREVLGAG